MDFDRFLTAEMITAFAVFIGALFGGVVAVIAEFRKPWEPKLPIAGEGVGEGEAETPADPSVREIITCVQEETDHVNRTLWVIEKKISEQLHRIEKEVLSAGQRGP